MKNLKKVLAFTLALAMILSTMTTAFAANESADKLSNLGLLLNTTDEELNSELTRSVGLAMVLKALGYSQADADVVAEKNTYVDMGDATWAKGFAVIGEELKITNGVSVEPKRFAPNQKLDKKSFVAFMLRALGYDLNEAWAKAGELAFAAKLVEQPEIEKVSFYKGEAAIIMYNALKAEVQGDTQKRSLAQKLVDEGKLNKDLAVANGLISSDPTKLQVVNISANNLVEIKVDFNAELDKATAEKASNYKVKARVVGEAKLLEDKKSVLLTLVGTNAALENKRANKLTVSKVKTDKGLMIEKTSLTFTPYDNESPKVEQIRYTGPRSLEITFSEPINPEPRQANSSLTIYDYSPTVTLKDGNAIYTTKLERIEGNVAYVKSYRAFKNGTEYLIGIGDPKRSNHYFYDFANYPNAYYEEKMVYEKDTTAPEAEVSALGQKWVKVKFNKPVTGLTKEHFYHSFSSYTPVEIYDSLGNNRQKIDVKDRVSTVYLQFFDDSDPRSKSNHALPGGIVSFTALRNANRVDIRDNWGNTFQTKNVNLTIIADREHPEVIQVEAIAKDKVKVTFNESVYKDDALFTLSHRNGAIAEKIRGARSEASYADNGKAIILDFDKSYVGQTMILTIKGLKDSTLYENEMPEYTAEVDFTDKEWDGPRSAYYIAEKVNTRTEMYKYYMAVVFNENMDDSATDSKNYRYLLNGNEYRFLLDDGDFFLGRQDVVRFELTKRQAEQLFGMGETTYGPKNARLEDNKVNLLVYRGIKDIAGNEDPLKFRTSVPVKDFNNYEVKIASAVATDTDRINVTFTDKLKNIDGEEFIVSDSTNRKYKVLAQYEVEYKDSVSLQLQDTDDCDLLTTGVEGLTIQYNERSNPDRARTRDIFDKVLVKNAHPVNVVDNIAPTILSFKYDEDNRNNPIEAFNKGSVTFGGRNDEDRYQNKRAVDKKPMVILEKENDSYYIKLFYSEKLADSTFGNTIYQIKSDNSVRFTANGTPVQAIAQDGDRHGRGSIVKIKIDDQYATKKFLNSDLTVTQTGYVADNSPARNTYKPEEEWTVYKGERTLEPITASYKLFGKYSTNGVDVKDAFNNSGSVTTTKAAEGEPQVVLINDSGTYKIKIAYAEKVKVENDEYKNYFNVVVPQGTTTISAATQDENVIILSLDDIDSSNLWSKEDLLGVKVSLKDNKTISVFDNSKVLASGNRELTVFPSDSVRNKLSVFKVFEKLAYGASEYSALAYNNDLDAYIISQSLEAVTGTPAAVITKEGNTGSEKYYVNIVYATDLDKETLESVAATDKYEVVSPDESIVTAINGNLLVEGNVVKFEVTLEKNEWSKDKPSVTIKQKATLKVKDATKFAGVTDIPVQETISVFGDMELRKKP